MPIKFRCRHCRQFLGISRAQAGEIADCPMCGKSIRVPNLDGSIDPIPAPELDLEDSQLVQALGELAEIGKSSKTVEATSPPRVLETRDATVIMPVAEPVARTVVVPATSVLATSQEDSDTIIQGGGDGVTVDEQAGPLQELAQALVRPEAVPTERTPFLQGRRRWVAGAAAVALAMLAGVLIFADKGVKSSTEEPRAETSVAIPAKASLVPAAQNDAAPVQPALAQSGLNGRVWYINDQGERLPDEGASLLFLPKTKLGTVKLDVAGFLAGAEPIDAQVSQAGFRALGGDIAHADADGQFQLHPGQESDGYLLAISHHQARPSGASIDTVLQNALAQYFWRPASLLGSLAFRFLDVKAPEAAHSSHEIVFGKE